jgi:hypothetical protein
MRGSDAATKRKDDLARKFGIEQQSGDPSADGLAALLIAHLVEGWPSDVDKGRSYGGIEAVLARPDIFGWALSALKGTLSDADRIKLSEYANEVEASLGEFPPLGRESFQRLVLLARSAVAFRFNN